MATTVKEEIYFEVIFLEGMNKNIISCKEVIFPTANEFFMTLKKIIFPLNETEIDILYIPKHLILAVRTRKIEKEVSNLVLLKNE